MSNIFFVNIIFGLIWVFLSFIGCIGWELYWLCFVLVWMVIVIVFNMWWKMVDFSGIDFI